MPGLDPAIHGLLALRVWKDVDARDKRGHDGGEGDTTSAKTALAGLSKIEIEGLHKTYASRNGRVAALADVTLSIKQNEFVTLVGPSGCGKSTLLKLIGALIRPSRGKLLFDGAPLFHPTRDVGIVFQEAVLLEWRTVLDNVMLPAEILGLDSRRSRARAMDLIALVGLGVIDRPFQLGRLAGARHSRDELHRGRRLSNHRLEL